MGKCSEFLSLAPGVAVGALARSIIVAKARRNRQLPPDEALKEALEFAHRNAFLFSRRSGLKNRFDTNWQNLVFNDALGAIQLRHPDFAPPTIIHGRDILKGAVASGRRLVMISVHTGLMESSMKVLDEEGCRIAFLRTRKPPANWLAPYRLTRRPNVILPDSDSLLLARKALKSGSVVYGCVDFTLKQSGSLISNRHVSLGLFEFARRNGASLLFSNARADAQGVVHTHFGQSTLIDSATDIFQFGQEFCDFVDATSAKLTDWSIVRTDSDPFRQRAEARAKRAKRRGRRD